MVYTFSDLSTNPVHHPLYKQIIFIPCNGDVPQVAIFLMYTVDTNKYKYSLGL